MDAPDSPDAVTETEEDAGILVGAVYRPAAEIEPELVVQEVAPVAVNCFVPPRGTDAAVGAMDAVEAPKFTGNGVPRLPPGFFASTAPAPAEPW